MSAQSLRSASPQSLREDILASLRNLRLVHHLAWREIAKQYDRTSIGILWVPLGVLIHILVIGFIFEKVFDSAKFIPYFACGYCAWIVGARVMQDSSSLWVRNEKFIRHVPVPLSVFVFAMVHKGAMLMAMTIPVALIVSVAWGVELSAQTLMVLPGLLLLVANIAAGGALLSVLSLRFPDFAKFVPSLLTMGYLATPIIWPVERLGEHAWIAQYNPLFHVIELVRAPMLGAAAPGFSWLVTIGVTLLFAALGYGALARARTRIVLWI